MPINPPRQYVFLLAVEVSLHLLQIIRLASTGDACMTYYFTRGKDMIENHVLRGHVIANLTAPEPLFCFKACRLECRCISFNFKQSAHQDNCQLNEENRYTNFGALEFAEGWQYYDLVIDYSVRVREHVLLPQPFSGPINDAHSWPLMTFPSFYSHDEHDWWLCKTFYFSFRISIIHSNLRNFLLKMCHFVNPDLYRSMAE